MLVLFETPAGYALFKVLDKGRIGEVGDIQEAFSTPDGAASVLKLKAFNKFDDTTKALAAATAICDDKLDKGLKRFLSENVKEKDKLAVMDLKLGSLIKRKLNLNCVYDDAIMELMRGIRQQLDTLMSGISPQDRQAMTLGLSHSLCRYKLKFSPDKVDTMIIQAISLLDELDKELNTYAMRVREWYGWHFPEMGKIVIDNIQYAKTVLKMGTRNHAKDTDLSDVLAEEVETPLKEAAEVSMGTEIAEEDILNIRSLCEQVIEIANYRTALFDYLKNRMQAIAPNLTVMVGELVGARLVAHAGSLLDLAKHPASTVQILGAEKALFRALKTKHETPKYGLIYHASLVGQAAPKFKGKISRVLAAKTAIAAREDALGDGEGVTIGFAAREKVENRLRTLEGGKVQSLSGTGKGKAAQAKYEKPNGTKSYNAAADTAMAVDEDGEEAPKSEKKKKKEKRAEPVEEPAEEEEEQPKKKQKRKIEEVDGDGAEPTTEKKKKKKKEKAADDDE